MTVRAKHWVKVSCGWVQTGEVFQVSDKEFDMISDAVEVLVEDPQNSKTETLVEGSHGGNAKVLVEESAAEAVDGKNVNEQAAAPKPEAPRKRGRKKV